MSMIASALVALVALAHVYFLLLEMVLWRTPFGLKTLGMTPEQAEATAVLAMNQGLYNGFLAAGLIWSLLAPAGLKRPLAIFFLGCVLAAGLFGGATASRKIFFVQALPAAVALALVLVVD